MTRHEVFILLQLVIANLLIVKFATGLQTKVTEKFIVVADGRNLKPERLRINMPRKCVNLPNYLKRTISSTDTNGHCVRFFDDYNCTGNSIELTPRSPGHHDLALWQFDNKIVSVGHCRDECDPEITAGIPKKPYTIQIFPEKDFKKPLLSNALNLRIEGCTRVPSTFVQKFASVYTGGHCIQLWSNPNCVQTDNFKDDMVELKNGSPWHSDIKSGWWMTLVSAVSYCGFKCNANNLTVVDTTEVFEEDEEPEKEAASALDDSNWTAEFEANGNGCFNRVANRTRNQSDILIKASAHECINFYASADCNQDPILVVNQKPDETVRYSFGRAVKSVKYCDLKTDKKASLDWLWFLIGALFGIFVFGSVYYLIPYLPLKVSSRLGVPQRVVFKVNEDY